MHVAAKKQEKGTESSRFNRISQPTNILFSIIFILISLICVLPFLFVVIISFTAQSSITVNGYSFFPDAWSLEAYKTLFTASESLYTALGNSVFITVVGTVLGLYLNSIMGYVLSRKNFKFHKLYNYIVFIPMVFYGGLVPTFMVVTQVLHLRDSIWAIILPLAVSSFYVIILRTFFTTTVPESLIESAKLDGATQGTIFFRVVLPISLPALATIALFLAFAYWNDWYQAMLYVSGVQDKWPLQYALISIERDLSFLTNNPTLSSVSKAQMLKNLPSEGVRMAMVVVSVVPIAMTYPFFQKYFASGLTVGAVKG